MANYSEIGKGWPENKISGVRKPKHNPHICVFCRSSKAFNKDHLIPKALGGKGSRHHNVVHSCQECNQRKGLLLPLEFMFARSDSKWNHLWYLHYIRQSRIAVRHAHNRLEAFERLLLERSRRYLTQKE